MRALLIALCVASCAGEQVADTATDGGVDSGADANCGRPPGELFVDGDFSTGAGAWRSQGDCLVDIVAGPCGKAAHLHQMTSACSISSGGSASFPAGSRIRFSAWLKKGTDAPPSADPKIAFRPYDGSKAGPDYILSSSLTDTWRQTERVLTLSEPMDGFEVIVDAYHINDGKTHDVQVADISLTQAP